MEAESTPIELIGGKYYRARIPELIWKYDYGQPNEPERVIIGIPARPVPGHLLVEMALTGASSEQVEETIRREVMEIPLGLTYNVMPGEYPDGTAALSTGDAIEEIDVLWIEAGPADTEEELRIDTD